jgi:hypothetical protein
MICSMPGCREHSVGGFQETILERSANGEEEEVKPYPIMWCDAHRSNRMPQCIGKQGHYLSGDGERLEASKCSKDSSAPAAAASE